MASCRKLALKPWKTIYPGHGAPVTAPAERLDWLVSHRLGRESAILKELANGPATPRDLARRIYSETPPALLGAAERNVLAHLIDLVQRGRARATDSLGISATYALV
jgi:glyoxylase-like metal-dependent hydrolase (beta-lactamase superfamily II)